MNIRNPTGSSLERAENCPKSFQLELQVRSTSEASIKGTENHKIVEDAIRSGNLSALKPKTIDFIMRFQVETADVESGCAINLTTGKVRDIDARSKNGYVGIADDEIPLTIDMCAYDHELNTWVVDWKSAGRVTPAAQNLQLLAGAYATNANKVAIHYLDDGETDEADIHEMDRAAFLVRARDIVKNIRDPNATLHEGPWCTYCPAKFACPAKTNYIKEALAIKPSELLSAERAGEIWLDLKRAENIVNTMKDAIKQMSNDVDIPLPNGRVLRRIGVKKSNVDNRAIEADYRARGKELPKYEFTYYTTKEVKP